MMTFLSVPLIQHQQIAAPLAVSTFQATPTPVVKKPLAVFNFQGSESLQTQNSGQASQLQHVVKNTAPALSQAPPPLPPPPQASSQLGGDLPPIPIDFDDEDEILEMSASTLKKSTPKSFGWIGDDQVREMLWGKKSFKGFELVLQGDETIWTKKSVKRQLQSMAVVFKRATIVLFLQANCKLSQQRPEPARLVTNTKHFLSKAGRMTKHCNVDALEVEKWTAWVEACEFFDQCLCANLKLQSKLRRAFCVDGYTWDDLQQRWDELKMTWLLNGDDGTMDPDEALGE